MLLLNSTAGASSAPLYPVVANNLHLWVCVVLLCGQITHATSTICWRSHTIPLVAPHVAVLTNGCATGVGKQWSFVVCHCTAFLEADTFGSGKKYELVQ